MTTRNHNHDDEDNSLSINVGLSEDEKRELEQMIGEFQNESSSAQPDLNSMQQQMETLNKRMAHLTSMVITIDRSLKPLSEVIRLTLEKCDLLNQRINTIIDSIRTGEPL